MNPLLRFVRFNAAGALGIVVQLTTLWLLVHLWAINYLAATIVAISAAVLHNFAWHWRWTWKDRGLTLREAPAALARFAAANGLVSVAGNLLLMAILVTAMHVPPVVANAIAIVACGLINFRLADRVVFRHAVRRANLST